MTFTGRRSSSLSPARSRVISRLGRRCRNAANERASAFNLGARRIRGAAMLEHSCASRGGSRNADRRPREGRTGPESAGGERQPLAISVRVVLTGLKLLLITCVATIVLLVAVRVGLGWTSAAADPALTLAIFIGLIAVSRVQARFRRGAPYAKD